ncbi:YraN family protein [Vibrio sp. UCD-FRSSP16_10]|uniref:YraN family protein n=1 Tax=unclassified Vibrio TaxID=2614977 RepID=UPI0007FC7810|nr:MULTISPECIES: YraN family protein [unclassified Vibrio]OBT07350.1 YraN family protein [Vibrio sp. UCD-FRSSP16_30]OBT12829.1 YraN family protein [Vibrio sp. UCD-FRSSP16_10]
MSLLNKQAIGYKYEAIAQRYLAKQGLVFIEKNFHAKCGEIDLIMQDKQEFVFIEVKYRTQQYFGSGVDAVSKTKQSRLKKTAMLWLMKNNHSPDNTYFRFDVVSLSGQSEQVEWIQNAIVEG